MTQITITVDDALFFALTSLAARKSSENPDKDATPLTEADYVQFVINSAGESWKQEFPQPDKAAIIQQAVAAIAAVKAVTTNEEFTALAQNELTKDAVVIPPTT